MGGALEFIDEISIHALRGEGDNFVRNLPINLTISIHALRGEGDKMSMAELSELENFNPRPPWGGRPQMYRRYDTYAKIFQSTPSVGRATLLLLELIYKFVISIHALRGEGDRQTPRSVLLS